MEEIVYLNGELIPRSEAKVPVYDQGFLYGYALFETMRAYHGRIFLLDRHLKRLSEAAVMLKLPVAGVDLAEACYRTLKANDLKEARLRLTISRGEMEAFPGDSAKVTPTVLVTARRYMPLPETIYQRGYTALISSFTRCAYSPFSRLKTANYLASIMARIEAEKAGIDEALLLNDQGMVAEGSASNVFFVAAGEIITPPLVSGILPGITRGVVLGLAQTLGIRVGEREVTPKDLTGFGEAFVTNSVVEIMPLVSVRGKDGIVTIGSGKPGKTTQKLMAAYKEMIRRGRE
ncbi:aminotransferase class IV [Chloroflexota bacterium]